MKRRITILLFAFLLGLSLFSYVKASSPTTIPITIYHQEKSNWCWAACAKMIGKYYTGTAKTQSNIVTYIFGSDGNYSAGVTEAASAATYASSGIRSYTGVSSIKTFPTIKNHIDSNNLLIGGFKVYVNGNYSGAHMMVINGYNTGTNNWVYFVDPTTQVSSFASYTNFITSFSFNGSTSTTFKYVSTVHP